MGWLNSRPKSHEKDSKPKSRYELLTDGDPNGDIPNCDPFISDCWNEIGRCGREKTPINYTDVLNYSRALELELSPFECRCIVNMSRDYVTEIYLAEEDLNRPPPHCKETFDGVLLGANISKAFKRMFSKAPR